MAENLDSTNEPTLDYMRESFTTDDGLVVPPPTREMGPRRLSRYRLDVADFLRALRDGTELPEEPVEYMGALPQGEAGTDTRKIYERFNELLEEGAFDVAETTSTTEVAEDDENVVETRFIEDDVVLTSDDLVDSQATPFDDSQLAEESSGEEVITSEELAEVIETAEHEEVDTAADAVVSSDEEPHRYSHLFDDETEQETAITEPVSEDTATYTSPQVPAETVTEEPAQEEAPVAPVEEKQTPNRFDLIRAKAAKARSVSTVNGLPKPVSALDSQGLDLESLNQAEERFAETRVTDDHQAHTVETPLAETEPEEISLEDASDEISTEPAVEEADSASSYSVADSVAHKSSHPEQQESSISPEVLEEAEVSTTIDMPEKNNNTPTVLIIASVVAIIVLVVIWIMFFKK